MTYASLRGFATLNEWNPGYAHKLKTSGRLVMATVDGKEVVDVEASMAKIASSSDPAKAHMAGVNARQRAAHRGAPHGAPHVAPLTSPSVYAPPQSSSSTNATYNQAKTAREVYEAKLAQLRFELESGRVVNADDVKSRLAARAAALREGLLQIPSRLSAVLAAESDQAKVHAALEAEIRSVLLQLTEARPA